MYSRGYRLISILLTVALMAINGGCATAPSRSDAPAKEITLTRLEEKEAGEPITEQEVESAVARFAAEYLDRVGQAMDELKLETTSPRIRAELVALQLDYLQAVVNITIGPEPEINLVDMLVFMTLGRIALEEYFVPQVFGSAGEDLLKTVRELENDIWVSASLVLSKEQQDQLLGLIQEWRERNPNQHYTSNIRLTDVASARGRYATGGGLLGVKEASRAIDEFTLVAQQLVFYLQVLPVLTRMQAELLTYQIVDMPEVEQLLANTDRLTATAERYAVMMEELSAEGKNLLQDLGSEEKRLRGLITEVRQTMSEGSELISLANTTVNSMDSLAGRIESGPFAPVLEGFDIKEYRATTEEATEALRQLNSIVQTMIDLPEGQQPLPFIIKMVDRVDGEVEGWITRAFVLAAALILVFFLTLLAYRYAAQRMYGPK
ncbi:MAG: hypothetical protein PVF76_01445 [Syntrophobacterales bacterium]